MKSQIKLLILDVDGVLTDGRLFYGPQGECLKAFHVHDGLGIKKLQQAGINVAIISSRNSPMVSKRLQELGITHAFQGQHNKLAAYLELKQTLGLENTQIAAVGDDEPDLAMFAQAGIGIAVANATDKVKAQADWITTRKGGKGAVREICEQLLEAHNDDH